MATTEAPADVRARLWRDGERWTLAADGAVVHLRDGKGPRYLAALAATPDVEHAALTLVAGDAGSTRGAPPLAPTTVARLRELDEELEEAEALCDLERAELLRDAIRALESSGDGDARLQQDAAAERARLNVTRALRVTVRRISGRAPVVGARLELSLQTGACCAFHPTPGFVLVVGPPPGRDLAA